MPDEQRKDRIGELPHQVKKGVRQTGAWASVVRASQGNFDHLMQVIRDVVTGHNSLVEDVSQIRDVIEGVVETESRIETAVRTTQGEVNAHTHADLSPVHVADTVDAHDASAISVDSTTLSGVGTDVQASLEEIDNLLDDHSARHDAGGADVLVIDAVAATGSLRTLGSGAQQAAGGTHVHGNVWTRVDKTTTETIQSDVVADPDAALKFTMGASKRYLFRFFIFYGTAAAADFKYDLTLSAGVITIIKWRVLAITPGASTFESVGVGESVGAGPFSLLGSGGNDGSIEIEGYVENDATAKDLQFSWAQVTSTAADTSVFKGSYLEHIEVA